MDVLEQGAGELFTDPDPDRAREFFHSKSRKMVSKLMPLKEAIERFVNDGEYLAIGGFGANRAPIAACHEIVRQGRKKMGFAGHTSTHDFQILAAGEVFDRCDAAYIVGLEARGLSPVSRRYMQSGRVRVTEWSNYSLAARLKAATMGVPFVPTRTIMGTETFTHSAAKIVECPFTGTKVVLQPALYPDVSVIHVHEADIYGNCRIRGIMIADDDLARASRKLIITCERLIPNDEIRRDPTATRIPYFLVDAVCETPYGAYPGNMAYEYFSDEEHLKDWLAAEEDAETFKGFMQKYIFGCRDHYEYIGLNGGLQRMIELRRKELMIHKEVANG